jgi:hypothetical protein
VAIALIKVWVAPIATHRSIAVVVMQVIPAGPARREGEREDVR